MSTIVCLQTGAREEIGADEYGVFNIVDGQQRLTTLIIILKALENKMLQGNDEQKKEATKLNELLIKGDKRLILLQTNHDSSSLFRKYLLEGTISAEDSISTAAEKNLVNAFHECETFVEKWPTGPVSLLKTVKNRLDFIFYSLDDEESVYTIFEVLNSRGLEVDWLDKCKSILMGIAFDKFKGKAGYEHISEIHKRWTRIYQAVGLKEIPGHEILRFAATLKHPEEQSRILSAADAVEFFRSYCEKEPSAVIQVSDEFLDIAKKLDKLYANPRLKAVTDIAHARLLAISVMLNKVMNNTEKEEILNAWESTTFKIFGLCGLDSRSEVGNYTRLAQSIISNKISKQEMVRNLNSLVEKDKVNDAIDKFKGKDCYFDWPNDDLLYFFYRYEEYLAEQAGASVSKETWEQIWSATPSTTVEHIYPETPGQGWQGKLGKGVRPETQMHRLGNLMILPPGVNSQAWNKPFEAKKEVYRKNHHLRLMDEILIKRDWNKAAIDEREKRLLKWAITTWG
jgi:hypothetical protein